MGDELAISGCDLVEVDVEGAENLVIIAARATLAQKMRNLSVEISPLHRVRT